MLSLTLIFLVSLVVGERPTEQDQIELLPHGHLVSKKQSSGSHILASEDSSASVRSHLPPPLLSKPGPGSFSELSSSDSDKHEVAGSPSPDSGMRQNRCQQGNRARRQNNDACMSLCHRIWCTLARQGSCEEFERELDSRGYQNVTTRSSRYINFANTKSEHQMDIWYFDLRQNMPHTAVMSDIRSLRGGVNYSAGTDKLRWSSGGMSPETIKDFEKPLLKIMRAFNLYEAWENAEAALNSRDGSLREVREQLQSAIDDVETHPQYKAMSYGLKKTRHVLNKLNSFYQLMKDVKEAKALSDSSAGLEDDTIDKMLTKLASVKKEADDVLGSEFDHEIGKLATVQEVLKKRLDDYFLGIIETAKEKEIMEESGDLRQSLDDLRPIITRMKALSPMYDDDQYLPRAVRLVATFENIFKTKFKEAVEKAHEAVKGRYELEEMDQNREDLEEQIKICDPMSDTFLNEYNDMQEAVAQIEAYVKLQDAIKACTDDRMNKFSAADEEAATPAEEEVPVASPDGKAMNISGKAKTDEAPVEAKAAPKALTPKQQALQTLKTQLAQDVRTGMDLCDCADMGRSISDMMIEAENLGVKLGGLPAKGACPASKKRVKGGCYGTNCPTEKKPFLKKMMGGLFGGGAQRSMQPAASAFAACLLLAPVLWMQV